MLVAKGSKLSYKSFAAITFWLFREPQQLVMGARSWMEPMIPYSTSALLMLGTTHSSASLSYPFLYSPWYLIWAWQRESSAASRQISAEVFRDKLG